MRYLLVCWIPISVLATCPLPDEIPPNEWPPGRARGGDVVYSNDGTDDFFECVTAGANLVYYIMQLEAGAKSFTSGGKFRCDAASGKWIHSQGYEAPARLNCGFRPFGFPYCAAFHTFSTVVGGVALYPDFEQYCPAGQIVAYGDGRGIKDIKLSTLKIEAEDGSVASYGQFPTASRPTLKCVTIPATCPAGGVWSEWVVTGVCATTCGSCSTAARQRTCTTDCGNCPCTGPSEDVGPCSDALCPFLNSASFTCCGPYKKTINYRRVKQLCGSGTVEAPKCRTP